MGTLARMSEVERYPRRTSETHPLRIDAVLVPGTTGRIGMTLCPGRRGFSTDGRPWERDLETDLEAIRAWGVDLAIALVEPFEFALLEIPDFRAIVSACGVPWRFVPIVDGAAPGRCFADIWPAVGGEARDVLRRGGSVLLHCRAGLGRTGTVAAALLVDFGMLPEAAIDFVRATRPNTIETRAQLTYLRSLRPPER